jgi:hypothetical protein
LGDDGKTIFGTVAEPSWVYDALPEGKVSLEFDRATKRIVGYARLTNPGIPDAVVFEAYAKFSRGEADSDKEQQMETEAPKKSALQRLMALFAEASPAEAAELSAAVAPAAEPAKSAREIALEAQVAAFEADKNCNRLQKMSTDAEAHYSALLTAGHVLPADKEQLIAAFTAASLADADKESRTGIACFATDFSLVAFLNEQLAKLPKHELGTEQASGLSPEQVAVFDQNKTTANDGKGKPVSASRIEELLSLTPIGNAALASANGANGGK